MIIRTLSLKKEVPKSENWRTILDIETWKLWERQGPNNHDDPYKIVRKD